MTAFCVRVDPNVGTWADGSKVYWHFTVPAQSSAEALAIMGRGDCKGMLAEVIPPLFGPSPVPGDPWFNEFD